MLSEFLTTSRELIIMRAREKVTNRPWPLASTSELEHGVPLFLSQLASILQSAGDATAAAQQAVIGRSATIHGRELLDLGFNVSQVVHDYGDICQAITELAIEQRAEITPHEFHVLNRCLDTAIAEAVTEHARLTAKARSTEEAQRTGRLAHEIRDLLSTAMFAFEAVKTGTVAINGSTGAVLGRSLVALRDLVGTALSDIRLTADVQRREPISVESFVTDIAVAARLHADYRGVRFSAEWLAPDVAMEMDKHLLTSAVMNLLNNAFKFTPADGHVTLRVQQADGHLRIEVEDECGGIPADLGDPFDAFNGGAGGHDRTGLGLGLAIARKAVRAHGGDIHVRNNPGTGCMFVVDLPIHTPVLAR